jgi:hypothetical protein
MGKMSKHLPGKQYFTVTDDHIKLLRAAIVGWDDGEFGAPSIDCKRPYGNSSVYNDIAEILGIDPEDVENQDFSSEQFDHMALLHKETQRALQVFLATGQMSAGEYVADQYHENWQRLALPDPPEVKQ